MNLAERVRAVVDLLASTGYRSALVGGLAVSIRARERFTKDVDLAVAVESDAETEELARTLQLRGLELLQVVEQDAKKVIATLRFRHPMDRNADPSIDLLFGASGIESEIVRCATPMQIAKGVSAPVASLAHLIATKVLSEAPNRPQDVLDLQVLLSAATGNEIEEARKALNLITARGFDRSKDLQACLEQLIRRFA